MQITLLEPLTSAAQIRVTCNDVVLLTKDFAAGETPDLKVDPPEGSCILNGFLVIDGKEQPVGTARYYCDDIKGATMLVEDANELGRKNKNAESRKLLKKAIAILEKVAPNSDEMADACISMSFCFWDSRGRRKDKATRRILALEWYEKGLSAYERSGNTTLLTCHLTNISAMYRRDGHLTTALARAQRALDLERAHPTSTDPGERSTAWSHAADLYRLTGDLDTAEAIIADGLAQLGEKTPSCGYLWAVRAYVFEERAKQCRTIAEEILPPQHCTI